MSIVPQYNLARRRGAVGLARSLYARYGSSRNRMYGSYTGMGAARRVAQRAARSYTMTRRRKTTSSGMGVTTQHDSRLIYRKKRMPSYKRRSLRAFSNKVNWAQEKDLGTQQYVINQLSTFNNTTSGNQVTADLSLYAFQSTNNRHNDLRDLSAFIAGAVTTPGTGLAVDPSSKIIFQSAILDVTIRNGSTFNGTSGSNARLEVDVYEMTFGTELAENGSFFPALIANDGLFAQNPTQTYSIGGAGTEISREKRGVTPFDLSYVLSRFKGKIYKKTKYQLSSGEQVTYQMRDPKRRVCTLRELQTQNGNNKPGWTKWLYITARLSPGLTVGAAVDTYQEVINIGMTRKYVYKVENYTEDRTQYNNL